MILTSDERTLLLLYYEDDKKTTLKNLTAMRGELSSEEEELYELTLSVIAKLSAMNEDEFRSLKLFDEMRW